MAEVVKPWWQAPSGYMFCIVEGGFYFDDIDGSCFPREDEATVDPMFIEALMQYKQREYPYFGRGRAMKIVYGQRVPPTIEYIAELKSGMLAELENTSVFLCPAAVVRFDSKPYKLVKSASHIDMKPYWSSKGTVKVRNPATARDLLDEFAKDNGIRIIEYDEYLPFREYYKF